MPPGARCARKANRIVFTLNCFGYDNCRGSLSQPRLAEQVTRIAMCGSRCRDGNRVLSKGHGTMVSESALRRISS
jgi:hypothetical protein